MKIEQYGLENYRVVEKGDKITAQGFTFEVDEIISQNDYGNDGGIYIEFEDPSGYYHYWKEGCDGGKVLDKRRPDLF